MKSAKTIELERRRLTLVDEARDLLETIKDAQDAALPALNKKHEANMRAIDLIDLDIAQAQLEDASEEARAAQRPHQPNGETRGFDDGLSSHNFPSGWTDQRGNPVRVLGSNERWAEGRSQGMGFGDHVRALVVGPRNDEEKRALAEGTGSAGGYTVPTPLAAEFIDRLRASSVAIRAGARTVPMTSETLAIARLDSDPDVKWRLENAEIEDSDPAFSRLQFDAKVLAGIVKVSREVLADSVNISEILTSAFAQAMALELDRVALWGTGADDGPIGVAGTPGINEVSMGNNGAALDGYDDLLDAVYEMQLDNAADPTGMVMHPRTGIALAKFKDGQGNPLTPPEMIASIPKFRTTAAPITETQGTATNASSILFGDFRHLFIGIREEMNISVLRERYADYGQVGFLCWMRTDVQLAHKASFSRLKGIIPA